MQDWFKYTFKVPKVKALIMQNDPFNDKIYDIIGLELVMH